MSLSLERTQREIIGVLCQGANRQVLPRIFKRLLRYLPRSCFLLKGTQLLLKESLLPGVARTLAQAFKIPPATVENLLRDKGWVVSDTEPAEEAARVHEYTRLVEEASRQGIAAFKTQVSDILTRELIQAGTDQRKTLGVVQELFKYLGLSGFRVYLYDSHSKDLRCLYSEQMQTESPYRTAWGKPQGAEAYLLQGVRSFLFIADRFQQGGWSLAAGERVEATFVREERAEAEKDALVYGGAERVKEKFCLKLAVGQGQVYLFSGNAYLKNQEKEFGPLFAHLPGGIKTAEELCIEIGRQIKVALVSAIAVSEGAAFSQQMETVSQLSSQMDLAGRKQGKGEKGLPRLVADALPVVFPRLQQASIILGENPEGLTLAASWGVHPYEEGGRAGAAIREREFDFSFSRWVLGRRTPFVRLRAFGRLDPPPRLEGRPPFADKGDVIVCPFYGQRVLGTVSIMSEARRYFNEKDVLILQYLVYMLASKMDTHSLMSELEHLAVYDPLTGIYNRRKGLEELEAAFTASSPNHVPLSVVVADLDFFKQVNDTYGHLIGDVVLREAAKRLSTAVKGQGLVSRYGGEEFLLILPRVGEAEAAQIAGQIIDAFGKRTFDIGHGRHLPQTVSLGVFCLSQDPAVDSVDEMVARADQALYKAKEQGRDRFVLWQPAAS